MAWVRRSATEALQHRCHPPTYSDGREALGVPGDLWRCDECGELWRVGDACDWCARHGHQPHSGQHAVGYAWRPATFWQRWKHRGRQ